MNLVIDIGNTLTKIAVFDKGEMVFFDKYSNPGVADIHNIITTYPDISAAIMGSVSGFSAEAKAYIESRIPLLVLESETSLPIRINYRTPASLGVDRIAGAVAANALYPDNNVLVIETGTCITYDLVDELGIYQGGSISPGIGLRFHALHNFTSKLPLVEPEPDTALIGTTTESSIRSGVINGIKAEVEGIILQYEGIYKNLTVIISGGNLNYFDKNLKNNIFAVPNIVLSGLNIILEFNDKN